MRSAVTGILMLFWIIVGYLGSLWAAKRFVSGRYRPEAVAAAVVVAFILGANWPNRFSFASNAPAVPTAPVTPGVAGLLPAKPAVEVGAACALARLSTVVGKGNLDRANVQTGTAIAPAESDAQLRTGDTLVALGWAANQAANAPAASVCVVVDGTIVPGVKVLYGGSRPDVASAYRNPEMTATAFEIHLPSVRLRTGAHRIQAAAVMADGSAELLSGQIQVIGPPVPGKS